MFGEPLRRLPLGAVPEGEIELSGHGTAAVDLVPARGRYKRHRSLFGHAWMA